MRIAVIGVGPRGLSVLERVISHAQAEAAGPPIELLLIEPGQLGLGIHRLEQPDYLLLNTIAGQLTIFSDEQMTPGMPVTTGPSFYEWCRLRRIAVRFDAFMPRRLLAEYLQWAVGEFLGRVPDRLTVRHLPVVAQAVRPDGAGAAVTLADGTEHRVDLAVVTTGHGLANAGPAGLSPADGSAQPGSGSLIGTPYPLPEQVERIPAGTTVALLGTGLTAMDVIAALTVGRGGEFADGRYRPSGQEPRIVLANRSGWLPCCRPNTTPDRRGAPARFLTAAGIAELREQAADGRLDFRRQIEPLVRQEVIARMGSATPAQTETVLQVLEPARETVADYRRYVDRLVDLARADLREAELGLGVSPVKEGLEVLRDHREGLRAAIDPPGLTADSHRYFMTEYVPLVNRAVIGPQKERIQELLILIDAGIVSLGPGPAPKLAPAGAGWILASTRLARPHQVAVDTVVRANLTWPADCGELDPVAGSLRTWVAPGNDGSLRLDRDGFAVPRGQDANGNGAGSAARSVAVFGPPAEGASYYNHYVPSPGVWSRALTDLDRALGLVLNARPAVRAAP